MELPNGVPDSDTFRRVFERAEPAELAGSLNAWLRGNEGGGGRNAGIDGKTICGSRSRNQSARHVASAWVADNRIALGELAVDEKSNEIAAIPELPDLMDVAGDIAAIDAMGCQKEIAAKIREKGRWARLVDYTKTRPKNQKLITKATTILWSL